MRKVVLIDDHALLRNALAKLIHGFEGYEVLFEANNGRHFIKMLDPNNLPNIVIMDITMPVMNGFETALWVTQNYPDMKVIALSMLNDERTIIKMLQNGARGYLLKDTEIDDLKKALDDVSNRGIYININTVNMTTKNFQWTTTFNASWQKEKIVSLANGKQDDINNNWFIGQPIGVIYGIRANGLWHLSDSTEYKKFNANGSTFSAGNVRPVDKNGDNKIDANNDRAIVGYTRPKWIVGMTNGFTYKNFELSIFMYGRLNYMFNTGGEAMVARASTRFFRVVTLPLTVQVKALPCKALKVRLSSTPVLRIEPTLARMALPGMPFEGAWGTFRIRPSTRLL